MVALLMTGICAGCGPESAGPVDPSSRISVELPAELIGAVVLYERDDGIYLRYLNQRHAERVLEHGSRPRWSPDGLSFACIRGNEILRRRLDASPEVLVSGGSYTAVAFHPDGHELFFIDGKSVKAVEIQSRTVREVLKGVKLFELDIGDNGNRIVATEKSMGYRVVSFDLKSGDKRKIAKGCSASLSPGGNLVTVNAGGHEKLLLRDSRGGREENVLRSPPGVKLDNQLWSNNGDWIAAVIEGDEQNIAAQRVSDGRLWTLTDEGDCDRPDLFIP